MIYIIYNDVFFSAIKYCLVQTVLICLFSNVETDLRVLKLFYYTQPFCALLPYYCQLDNIVTKLIKTNFSHIFFAGIILDQADSEKKYFLIKNGYSLSVT